jgi:predicted RNase H-like HicB family nuclease
VNQSRSAAIPAGELGCSVNSLRKENIMKAEFTAIIEPAPEGGYWAICPEVPGANGQGETIEETKNSLRQAIELLLEDRRADILRGLPDDAIQDKVEIG